MFQTMKRITYDTTRFKPIMLAHEVYGALKRVKGSDESFTDVVRKLIRLASRRDIAWSVVTPVQSPVKEFYRSELFA